MTARLLADPDEAVRRTIIRQNNNKISAFEIAAITNNSAAACYLAEVTHNMLEAAEAADTLNCTDSQGNTILHLLARKGDSNKETLAALLGLRLTDGSRLFSLLPNTNGQFPLHIAAQAAQHQPETLRLLAGRAGPAGWDTRDSDGLAPLHHACQRSSDPRLLAALLPHTRHTINTTTCAGLTALDLVARRTEQVESMFRYAFHVFMVSIRGRSPGRDSTRSARRAGLR